MLPDEDIRSKNVAAYQQLIQRHPHLPTKALVDLVNGIDVAHDHLRVAKQTDSKFLQRLLAGITGKTQARMTRVSAVLVEGLEVTTDWIKDIEASLKNNILAVEFVANNLHALEQRLINANIELREEVRETLHVAITRFGQIHEALEGRVLAIERENAGNRHLKLIVARWSDANCYGYPPIAVALSIVSELWWGDFGSYYRAETSDRARKDFLEIAQSEVAKLVAQADDTTTKRFSPREAVFAPLERVSVLEREAMQLLASPNVVARTPLLNLIADQTQSVEALPKVFTPFGLTKRVFLELPRATELV